MVAKKTAAKNEVWAAEVQVEWEAEATLHPMEYGSFESSPTRAELLEALAAAIDATPVKSRAHMLPELIRGVIK